MSYSAVDADKQQQIADAFLQGLLTTADAEYSRFRTDKGISPGSRIVSHIDLGYIAVTSDGVDRLLPDDLLVEINRAVKGDEPFDPDLIARLGVNLDGLADRVTN